MIFFMVEKEDAKRWSYKSVKSHATTVQEWKHNDRLAVAWNEVYSDLNSFANAVIEAAKNDPVCKAMAVISKRTFKLDPFSADDTVRTLFTKILRRWLSPMIGNITNWPNIRPTDVMKQLETNWTGSTSFAAGTLQRITELINQGRFYTDEDVILGHRDQSPFFYNIVEAARALLGELTSHFSRKLEKIFALRLVRSAELLKNQQEMLRTFWNKYWGNGDDEKETFCNKAKTKKMYEYLRYYIVGFDTLKDEDLVETLKELIAHSAGLTSEERNKGVGSAVEGGGSGCVSDKAVEQWKRLPLVIACAILISDIPRIFGEPNDMKADRPRVTYQLAEWTNNYQKAWTIVPQSLPSDDTKPPHSKDYKTQFVILRDDTFNLHAPKVKVGSVEPRLFGWVRNEYAPETITYRMNLCPIWGGSSGHATGRISWWARFIKKETPVRLTVASSYVALWRLYYDKRVSPVHLLVETYEATLAYSSAISTTKHNTLKDLFTTRPEEKDPNGDAFSLVLTCAQKEGANMGKDYNDLGVNPLAVWASILNSHMPSKFFVNTLDSVLSKQIDDLRDKIVDDGNWLPRWSHEKSMKAATAVASHVHS
jgi:hypothetical protein